MRRRSSYDAPKQERASYAPHITLTVLTVGYLVMGALGAMAYATGVHP